MLELYKNIKQKRIEHGWTQSDLAARMGYSDKSMISKIESGKVDLARSKILDFARVLGCPASELMGDVPLDTTPDIDLALEMYKRYVKAAPNIQSAVQSLLGDIQQDS